MIFPSVEGAAMTAVGSQEIPIAFAPSRSAPIFPSQADIPPW